MILWSFEYMQCSDFYRISLPAVAMTLVSSNMSNWSLLIRHHQAFHASYSASPAAAYCSGDGLQVPAWMPKAPYKDIFFTQWESMSTPYPYEPARGILKAQPLGEKHWGAWSGEDSLASYGWLQSQPWSGGIESIKQNHLSWKKPLMVIQSSFPAMNRDTHSSMRSSEPRPAWPLVSPGMGYCHLSGQSVPVHLWSKFMNFILKY